MYLRFFYRAFRKYFTKYSLSFLEKWNNKSIITLAQIHQEDNFFNVSTSNILSLIDDKKLWAVDIGAREGENSKFEKYSCCFNKILVEADTIEAKKLKSKGNITIDKAIGKKQNKLKNFYITQGEGCSSLLKPKDINIEFYTSGNTKRFKIKNITKVSVIDLHTALLPHTDVIHYLKIDTQGNEYDVVEGMGKYRPIILKIESSLTELYQEQNLFEDLCTLMRKYGYTIFHQTLIHRCAPKTHNSRSPFSETSLPFHGDVYFMPDWNTQNGIDIINLDKNAYLAMMKIFNMSEIASFILEKISKA